MKPTDLSTKSMEVLENKSTNYIHEIARKRKTILSSIKYQIQDVFMGNHYAYGCDTLVDEFTRSKLNL